MMFAIRSIWSMIVRTRSRLPSGTAASSSSAWPRMTLIGVPISWARPAAIVPTDASCSAARARAVVFLRAWRCSSTFCASPAARLGQLARQRVELLLATLDVGLHRQLGVQHEELLERG